MVPVPFLGIEVGIVEIFFTILACVFGWFLGNIIKLAIKLVIVFVVIAVILIGLGVWSTDIFNMLTPIISLLQPLLPALSGIAGFFKTISLPLIGFVIGLIIGVVTK